MPSVRLALWIAAALALAAACGRGGNGPEAPPLPVTTAPAEKAQIPVYIEHVGTTEAVNTIEVRARVQGVLEKVLFKEGADVEKDALLSVIEQKPYHQLRHQLACLFRQHSPQRARLIEAREIRQTEQVELMDWPVIGRRTLTLASHEYSPGSGREPHLLRPKPGYSMTRTGRAGLLRR